MKIPHDFFLITARKSTSFLIDSWNFHVLFFQYPQNSMPSTPPPSSPLCLHFFWNSPFLFMWLKFQKRLFAGKALFRILPNLHGGVFFAQSLTLSYRKSLSCKNRFIDLLCKSMDWLLYHRDLRHERVDHFSKKAPTVLFDRVRNKILSGVLQNNCLKKVLKFHSL